MRGPVFRFSLCVTSLLLLLACSEPPQPSITLYRAIHAGDLDQIKRHLYWGTDIDVPDPDGQMPLHVAASRGRVVITRMLLDHGAPIDARNRDGHTALYLAVMNGKLKVADLLRKRGADFDPTRLLFEVASQDVTYRDVVAYLVKHGADINAANPDGDTPLLVAVRLGHRVPAKRLIDAGADVNVADREGTTPLQIATQANSRDIAALLTRYGASATTR